MLLCVFFHGSSYSAKINFKEAPKPVQQVFKSENSLIHADILSYIPEENLVVASGNVEISQDGRILLADKLTYNQVTTVVEAIGNVSMLEPDGSVFFANNVQLKDNMKQGIIDSFSARFNDESLVAANKAIRVNENVTKLQRAVYSPCKVCEGYAGKTPMWQIRSNQVKIDNEEEKVTYNHAFFELYGAPVLYTPYLSHATPNASKKSGFLIPSYSNDTALGTIVKTPYFLNIASNMDTTITPVYVGLESPVMEGEFRHLLESGQYTLEGSITNPDKRDGAGKRTAGQEIRGHIKGSGDFDINDTWSWGFVGERSSDDTYLQRYKYNARDLLTSRAYVEQIDGNDYFGTEAITFQGLNAGDDPDATPLILPLTESHLQTENGWRGSWWTLDSNLMVLSRTTGVDSRRLSSKASWQLPMKTSSGHLFKLKTSLRGDVYDVNDVPNPEDTNNPHDGFVGRAIPEMELDWSWPLARTGESTNILFEPVAQFIVSPHGNNPNKVPNEDSQETEISDMNLFSSNHFTGLDLVEGGPRTNYGLRGRMDIYDIANINTLFGQSYRVKEEAKFTPESGLDENLSDYVGRFGVSVLQDNVDLNYRFRLDKEDFSSRRSEVDSSFTAGPVSASVGYIRLNEGTVTNPILDREEIVTSGNYNFLDFWSLTGNARRDLSEGGGLINGGGGISFINECLVFSILYNRDFTQDRDVEQSQTITFQLHLKNLN